MQVSKPLPMLCSSPNSFMALSSLLRRTRLEQTLQLAQLLHSCEEEEAWLREHRQLMEKAALGRDLAQISTALQKHKVSVHSVPCSDIPPSLPVRLSIPGVTSPSLHTPNPARLWKPNSIATSLCVQISYRGVATSVSEGSRHSQILWKGPKLCREHGSYSGLKPQGGAPGCKMHCWLGR